MFRSVSVQLPNSSLKVDMGINECDMVCKITDSRGNNVFVDFWDIKAINKLFQDSLEVQEVA